MRIVCVRACMCVQLISLWLEQHFAHFTVKTKGCN